MASFGTTLMAFYGTNYLAGPAVCVVVDPRSIKLMAFHGTHYSDGTKLMVTWMAILMVVFGTLPLAGSAVFMNLRAIKLMAFYRTPQWIRSLFTTALLSVIHSSYPSLTITMAVYETME